MHFSSIICVGFTNNYCTFSINNDNNVFSIGYSNFNAHGHKNQNIFPIKQIKGLTNIKMISCGNVHSLCIDYNGNVFSFGRNDKGQLGIDKDEKELEFTHIPQQINLPSCKRVSCGNAFNICLTEDNLLYSFGSNNYGQLGLRNYDNFNSPQLIPDINDIQLIECGGSHFICKTYENICYAWGRNEFGQLGNGNNDKSCNKPIQCLNWPENVIDIKCGVVHTLLLTSEGQVYSFGDNQDGTLGINDKTIDSINIPTLIKDIPEIQRIECGYYHSICIDINNNLWMFGNNKSGQFGLGDTENRFKPIMHPTLSNIMDISSGGHHTFVKTFDNKIYAFGFNKYSQLGIKSSEDKQLTPIQVFIDNEDIWCSTIGKSRQKSARK